ncbi:protein of unknown function [Limnospira indica PCC 8005]|uniref:Uncharacterized protein n=1 Tax=Limnospira indica PCC 8005 TaxID=376219 RepID=A0A9P1KE10_9CYAN|nr:protein of unknown function [Limnospira indica PCC 8005]
MVNGNNRYRNKNKSFISFRSKGFLALMFRGGETEVGSNPEGTRLTKVNQFEQERRKSWDLHIAALATAKIPNPLKPPLVK